MSGTIPSSGTASVEGESWSDVKLSAVSDWSTDTRTGKVGLADESAAPVPDTLQPTANTDKSTAAVTMIGVNLWLSTAWDS